MNAKYDKARPCIALLIDWTENMFHVDLIKGIRSKVEECDGNLIVYVGGGINSPRKWESPRNVIYDMVSQELISGIIIASASIGTFCTFNQIFDFCRKFGSIPVVSISVPIPGIPSIVTENKIAFKKLLLHLIQVHKYRRIAFIKGPEGNPDANERLEVYRSVLTECRIPLDNDLVEEGIFVWQSGEEAVRNIIEYKRLKIEAICAANDEMAIGAREALSRYGMRVPQDIAVTGFDDQDLSKYMSPPLTTVKQPVFEEGQRAVEILMLLMSGKKVDEKTVMDTEVIIRESCGCMPTLLKKNTVSEPTHIHGSVRSGERNNTYSPISIAVRIDTGNSIPSDKERRKIEEILFNTGDTDKESDFLQSFISILRNTVTNGSEEDGFFEFLDSLRNEASRRIVSIAELARVNDLLYQASLFVTDTYRRRERYFNSISGRGVRDFRNLSEEMVSIEEMEDIFHILSHNMTYVGIIGCHFSFYEQDGSGNISLSPSPFSRLVSSITPGKELPIAKPGIVYPTSMLLPPAFLPVDRRFTIYVEPLFFGRHHLGLALFEFDAKQGMVQNTMQRMFINSVLKAAVFLKQVQNHSLNLEAQVQARTEALSSANELLKQLYEEQKKTEDEVKRLNEDLEKRVTERTSELLETNNKLKRILRRLKRTQAKLVQSEKMAALGGLVAGIAHEINTPIGIGVTAASHLEVSIKELDRRFKDGTMKKSDLLEHISASKDTARMILSNLNRAFDLIRSFKQVAVDQTSEKKRLFKIKEYIDEVLLSLKPQLKKTGHLITIRCPDDLAITSYPGPFSQVITNLVMNSIMHAFDEGVIGEIVIEISESDGMIRLLFSDNGKGIKKEYLKKIYEPFFTTKRGRGGTGLGLHLVYNIVVRTLGGAIECSSEEGKGTTFTIVFTG